MPTTKSYTEYREKQLAIDVDRLDEEWQQQPVLYDRAQQGVVDAERSFKEAEKDLRELKSRLRIKILKDPEKYDLFPDKKPTEGDINAVFEQNEHCVRATELKDTLEGYLNEARNFVRSVEMKKSSLTKLAELWIGNYYSTPQVNKSKGGKQFTDFIYSKLANKQRENLIKGANKRKSERDEILNRMAGKHAKKQLEELCEEEDRVLRPKRKKMLGQEESSKPSKKKRRTITRTRR